MKIRCEKSKIKNPGERFSAYTPEGVVTKKYDKYNQNFFHKKDKEIYIYKTLLYNSRPGPRVTSKI